MVGTADAEGVDEQVELRSSGGEPAVAQADMGPPMTTRPAKPAMSDGSGSPAKTCRMSTITPAVASASPIA